MDNDSFERMVEVPRGTSKFSAGLDLAINQSEHSELKSLRLCGVINNSCWFELAERGVGIKVCRDIELLSIQTSSGWWFDNVICKPEIRSYLNELFNRDGFQFLDLSCISCISCVTLEHLNPFLDTLPTNLWKKIIPRKERLLLDDIRWVDTICVRSWWSREQQMQLADEMLEAYQNFFNAQRDIKWTTVSPASHVIEYTSLPIIPIGEVNWDIIEQKVDILSQSSNTVKVGLVARRAFKHNHLNSSETRLQRIRLASVILDTCKNSRLATLILEKLVDEYDPERDRKEHGCAHWYLASAIRTDVSYSSRISELETEAIKEGYLNGCENCIVWDMHFKRRMRYFDDDEDDVIDYDDDDDDVCPFPFCRNRKLK